MPFEYKVDHVINEDSLEEAINFWAGRGYEPHTIVTLMRQSKFSDTSIPVLVLIVRKVVRRSRKKNEVKG